MKKHTTPFNQKSPRYATQVRDHNIDDFTNEMFHIAQASEKHRKTMEAADVAGFCVLQLKALLLTCMIRCRKDIDCRKYAILMIYARICRLNREFSALHPSDRDFKFV